MISAVSIVALVNIISAVTHGIISSRLLKELRRPRICSALVPSLIRFGGALLVSSIAAAFLLSAEKIVLAYFSSPTTLAYYFVASTVASLLTVIPLALGQSLLPAFSQLQGEESKNSLQLLYTKAIRATLLSVAPVIALLCLAAKPLFAIWGGPEFAENSPPPFYVLLIGLSFNVIASVPYTLLLAANRSDLVARFHVFELVPYVVCACLLVNLFGVLGAAIAWSLRMVVDAVLFFLAVRQKAGVSLGPLISTVLSSTPAMVILCVPLIFAEFNIPQIVLILCTITSVMAYGALLWSCVLTREERFWFFHLNRSAWGRARGRFLGS